MRDQNEGWRESGRHTVKKVSSFLHSHDTRGRYITFRSMSFVCVVCGIGMQQGSVVLEDETGVMEKWK